MTKDDLVRMSHEAGEYADQNHEKHGGWLEAERHQFAALVAAHDREDAERYRWLREQIYIDEDKRLRIARTYLISDQGKTLQERLDYAIDAARGKS